MIGFEGAVATRNQFCNVARGAAVHPLPLPDAADLKEEFDLGAAGARRAARRSWNSLSCPSDPVCSDFLSSRSPGQSNAQIAALTETRPSARDRWPR
jgi:hypothetical protein